MADYRVEIVDGSRFECAEEERVLIAMERLGLQDIFVGCRGGGCGVCKVKVTSGKYRTGKMSKLQVSDAEQAEGFVLACKLFPLEDLVIELLN
ncbi:MAG: ferredoxin [Alphaproteobacteria bacterium]|nr:ferredoxin [Alphaproteobacteria bacterium]